MTVKELNPDSVMLRQMDMQWQKFCALILWKLKGREKIMITSQEMDALITEFQPGCPAIMAWGHDDCIEFQVMDEAAAQRIADHDAKMQGNA